MGMIGRTIAGRVGRGVGGAFVVLAGVVLLGGWLIVSGTGSAREGTPAARPNGDHQALSSLPGAARAPISAALGAEDSAYRVVGFIARNPAQRLSARFGPSNVAIGTGQTRLTIGLRAVGRPHALRALGTPIESVDRNRVNYALGPVREWWANGPLGLEQGFEVARPPAGRGPLTLALAMPGATQLGRGMLALPGGLRYAGLSARDASGRTLPAWFAVRAGRVLIAVDDRGARYPVRVDPFVQGPTLKPSDGVGGDQFGYSVAVSGNTIAVGAPDHSVSTARQGTVYVFVKGSSGWQQAAELVASDPDDASDELGWSVAISGNTIVAGAPFHNESGGEGGLAGSVYVYVEPAGGWSGTIAAPSMAGTAELTMSDATVADHLGASVAITGSTVVAGAPEHIVGSNRQGAVYVFNEPSGGWAGTIAAPSTAGTAELTAADGAQGDELGTSVAITPTFSREGEGATIAAGAPGKTVAGFGGAGLVYLWSERLSFPFGWAQGTELSASDGRGSDDLGTSVAISGNTVLAGAPGHLVTFDCGTGCTHTEEGAAYVWVNPSGTSANQTTELWMSDGNESDLFGSTVALEGNTAVVGTFNNPRDYVFIEPSAGWTVPSYFQTFELTTSAGAGASVGLDGNTIVAGANPGIDSKKAGAAVVFTRSLPAISISSPANNATYGEGESLDAEYSCTAPSGATVTQCSGPVADGAPISTSTPGTYSFTVTADDSDGASNSRTVDYTIAEPQVTKLSPPAGPTAGGNTVKIYGTGFAPGATVDFGTVPSSSVTYETVHELSVVAPAGAIGTVDVTVTSPGGGATSTTSSADEYTYDPAPTVTAVSPDSGPAAGGTSVTIAGTGFVSGARVNFGAVAASSVTFVSSTELSAVAPAEAADLVGIHVITPGGVSTSSSADYYVFGPPTITSINPEAGPISGGNTVTIKGTGFVSDAHVSFGSSPASSVTYVGPTELTAVAPAEAAGTADIQVTTGGGTNATSSADQYLFGAPSLTGVSPTSGPVAGGNTVTITGTGFVADARVIFGSTAAGSVTHVSPTELTAVAPAESAGTVNVRVDTGAGASPASSADRYTFS